MFNSLKNFIELRLGKGLIIDELVQGYGYFIKTSHQRVDLLISFLKSDPDLRLNLLDRIIVLPKDGAVFEPEAYDPASTSIMYQLKSLKLPYRVSLVIEINNKTDSIKSIARHFSGARWLEEDISRKYDLLIEDLGTESLPKIDRL